MHVCGPNELEIKKNLACTPTLHTYHVLIQITIFLPFRYLVCVGFYDGSVAVFNVLEQKETPVYKSTAKSGKHTDPVWQVCKVYFM